MLYSYYLSSILYNFYYSVFRFELAIEFLSSTELDTLCNLFDKLEESLKFGQQDLAEQGVTEWSLSTLRKKYKV